MTCAGCPYNEICQYEITGVCPSKAEYQKHRKTELKITLHEKGKYRIVTVLVSAPPGAEYGDN
jgi:hypothetical protein